MHARDPVHTVLARTRYLAFTKHVPLLDFRGSPCNLQIVSRGTLVAACARGHPSFIRCHPPPCVYHTNAHASITFYDIYVWL